VLGASGKTRAEEAEAGIINADARFNIWGLDRQSQWLLLSCLIEEYDDIWNFREGWIKVKKSLQEARAMCNPILSAAGPKRTIALSSIAPPMRDFWGQQLDQIEKELTRLMNLLSFTNNHYWTMYGMRVDRMRDERNSLEAYFDQRGIDYTTAKREMARHPNGID
jgi:hypothetical protein